MYFSVYFTAEPATPKGTISAIYEPRPIGIEILDELRAAYPDLNIEDKDLPSKVERLYRTGLNEIILSEDTARKTKQFAKVNKLEVKVINGYDKIREHLKIKIVDAPHPLGRY